MEWIAAPVTEQPILETRHNHVRPVELRNGEEHITATTEQVMPLEKPDVIFVASRNSCPVIC